MITFVLVLRHSIEKRSNSTVLQFFVKIVEVLFLWPWLKRWECVNIAAFLHLAFASLPCSGIKLHVQEKGKWKPGFYNIAVSCSFIFQFGSDLGVSNPSMKSMKAVLRIMAVVAIPFTAQFPAVSVAIDTLLLNQKVTIHLKSNSPPDHSIAIKRLYFIWFII